MVGAFPQPFLNGYDGKRRQTVIVSLDPGAVRAVARRLHATSSARRGSALDQRERGLGAPGAARARASSRRRAAARRRPSSSRSAATRSCCSEPWPFRYRYEVAGEPGSRRRCCSPRWRPPRCSPTGSSRWRRSRSCCCSSACALRRAGGGLYLVGALGSGLAVFVLTPFVSIDRLARDLERADRAGARAARRHARGAAHRALPGTAPDRGRARVRGLRAAARPRPSRPVGAGSRAARCWRWRWRRGSCRRSSGTPRGSSRRCAGAGWRSGRARPGAAARRRCWRARSSVRSISPRRWRRAATADPARRGCRGPAGGRSTAPRSSWAPLAVAIGALWL